MRKYILFGIATCFFSSLALADSTTTSIECTSKGRTGNQIGGRLWVNAKLEMKVTNDEQTGALTLQASGEIKTAGDWEELKSVEEMNEDNSYIGVFSVRDLSENTKYKPRKYKGYAQFPNFDAYETTGNEGGMWGQLVLQRTFKTAKKFSAHYIFQAGDHMGGTIHFSCQRQ